MTDAPRPQELPPCPRHPDKLCSGECQYILPGDACWHDGLAVTQTGAALAADALRRALADSATMGEPSTAHLRVARPGRSHWRVSWANVPGLAMHRFSSGDVFTHALLPGWEYTREEVRTEMLADLERLASTGEQPSKATR